MVVVQCLMLIRLHVAKIVIREDRVTTPTFFSIAPRTDIMALGYGMFQWLSVRVSANVTPLSLY